MIEPDCCLALRCHAARCTKVQICRCTACWAFTTAGATLSKEKPARSHSRRVFTFCASQRISMRCMPSFETAKFVIARTASVINPNPWYRLLHQNPISHFPADQSGRCMPLAPTNPASFLEKISIGKSFLERYAAAPSRQNLSEASIEGSLRAQGSDMLHARRSVSVSTIASYTAPASPGRGHRIDSRSV